MKSIQNSNKSIVKIMTKIAIIIVLVFNFNLKAQPGSLDLSFNGNGKFISFFNGNCRSIAQQSDGKFILGASGFYASSVAFSCVRVNTTGTLDNTFGINGLAEIDITPNFDKCQDIAIQADDKIVMAGYSNNGTNEDVAIVRLNVDGTIDNSFGNNGIVTTTVSTFDERVASIVIQSDGKIVVGGMANTGASFDFMVIRYNTDGSLDNSFGINGIVLTDIGSAVYDEIRAIDLQSDGKIIVGGMHDANGYKFCLARYNTDGTIDNTFGILGRVITPIGSNTGIELNAISIQNDGKIVAAGTSANISSRVFTLVRYDVNGSLDNSFGNLGIVTTAGAFINGYIYSVKIQTDGKIVAMGYVEFGTDNDAAIVRYNSNGTLDNTFGLGGIVFNPIGSTYDFVQDGILDSNGKIILAGIFDNNIGVARFIGECNLDTTVTRNGIILSSNQMGTHQWLDCNNSMTPLFGGTGQTYTPTVNGSFAVQISYNGCVDTTACANITSVGLHEIEAGNHFKIYPNPTTGEFKISMMKGIYTIVNSIGEIVRIIEVRNDTEVVDVKGLQQGIYYIIGKAVKVKIIIAK